MSAATAAVHVPVRVTLELDDNACDALLRALADAYGQGRDDEAAALPVPEWVEAIRRVKETGA